MMKLAYMINLPGYTPETYCEYNTGEEHYKNRRNR